MEASGFCLHPGFSAASLRETRGGSEHVRATGFIWASLRTIIILTPSIGQLHESKAVHLDHSVADKIRLQASAVMLPRHIRPPNNTPAFETSGRKETACGFERELFKTTTTQV